MLLNRRVGWLAVIVLLIVLAGRLAPVRAQDDEAMRIYDLARRVHYEDIDQGNYTTWINGDMGEEQSGRPGNVDVGDVFPDFKFKLFNKDGDITRAKMKGPYLINFWASWCPPCKSEFPRLADSVEHHDLSIPVLFVNVYDKTSDTQRFLWTLTPKVTIAIDDAKSSFARKYAIDSIPQTILVDADGNIQAIQSGEMTNLAIQFFNEIAEHPGVGAFDSTNPDQPPDPMPDGSDITQKSGMSHPQ